MMTDRLYLSSKHRRVLEALLRKHLPDVEVWAYGSRVNGRSHDGSDLDLVLRGPDLNEIPSGQLGEFEEAVRESTIPFLVEARDWARMPERFRQEIEREYVVLAGAEDPCAIDAWRETNLGNVIELKRGYDLPQHERSDGDVPVVSSSGVIGHHRQSKVSGPGVVTGRYGTLGQVFFITADFWPLNTALYVRDFKGNDPRFISYLLKALDVYKYADKAAVPGLNRNHLHQEIVRVPSGIVEQRAIAHILGTLDDKIELNRRMNETLEAMARALFKSWFVDFDPVRAKMEGRDTALPANVTDLFPDHLVPSDYGQIPQGWKHGSFHEVASLNVESWSEKRRPAKLAYVDLTNTKWGHIEKVDTFPWEEAPSRARRVLRKGDTIIATVRPGNGSFALIGEDGLTGSTGFAVLRPKEEFDREFVWCATTSPENIDRLTRLADGGAYPAVGSDDVVAAPIVLADQATRATFSRLASALLDKVERNRRESQCLSAQRDTLLPMLFSGKLCDGR